MHCPFCNTADTKVIDSRLLRETNQIRRRRACLHCNERFTTYESVELTLPRVIKHDGTRALFSENKLRAGMLRALEKRPVSAADVEAAIGRILRKAMTFGERELPSTQIGEWVMTELYELDKVAYVRFASVYRAFDLKAFQLEINKLTRHAKRHKTASAA